MSDDDDDGSYGDGTVICLECSVGLATRIASRAAWWPILEAVSVAALHDDGRKNIAARGDANAVALAARVHDRDCKTN